LVQPKTGGLGFTDLIRGEPLGLEMLAGALADHEVRIIDLRFTHRLSEIISSFRPDLCGLSCSYTIDFYPTLLLARQVRKLVPSAFIIVGGQHASLNPQDFAGSAVDAVATGEGEETIKELAEALETGTDPAGVPGLIINKNGDQVFTPTRPQITPLDQSPFPRRRVFGHKSGYHLGFQRPLALVETSRGCPHKCSFCSVWQFYHGKYREKSAKRVVEELTRIDEPYVLFVDDNFLANISKAERIGRLIEAEKIKKHYTFQSRSDTITLFPDIIELWKKIGLKGVFIGFEKIEDQDLDHLHKDNSIANNEAALKILQAMKLDVWASFIVDPEFDHQDFDRLKRYITSRKINTPTFSVLTPLPGTRLFHQLKQYLTTEDYNLFDIAHSVLPTRLPLMEFYKEFCSLYQLPYSRTQLVGEGFKAWLFRGFSLIRLIQMLLKAKKLSAPDSYLQAHGPSGYSRFPH